VWCVSVFVDEGESAHVDVGLSSISVRCSCCALCVYRF